MALMIRSTKVGKKGESKFRVIVKEKRDKRDGKVVEYLGWYEKTTTGIKKELKKERINYWLSVGAKPSVIVDKLLK